MPFVHRLHECVGNPGAHPHHGGLLDAELHCDGVGGLEPNAADVAESDAGRTGFRRKADSNPMIADSR